MKKTWITALLVLVVLISGCTYGPKTTPQPTPAQSVTTTTPATTQPATAPASAAMVEIKGFAFNPATTTISKGTTVTWTQEDSAQHTVTGNTFSSDILSQGQTFSYTFNDTGTFEYNCHIHPSMRGKVVVT